MTKIKSLPPHLRPREKLLEKGPSGLSDAELLAILVRIGRAGHSAIDIAKDILKNFPLTKLSKITLSNLKQIKGMDVAKAASIIASIELSSRLSHAPASRSIIQNPIDVLPFLLDLRTATREHFVAIYLNARQELIHKETIFIGTLDRTLVHPREVFAPALQHLAAAILVAHNHPSGDCKPSQADQELTSQLKSSGDILGIQLVDHLIITKDSHFSFRENGLFTKEKM